MKPDTQTKLIFPILFTAIFLSGGVFSPLFAHIAGERPRPLRIQEIQSCRLVSTTPGLTITAVDTNGDGKPDRWDIDVDGDGTTDVSLNDSNGDGIPDIPQGTQGQPNLDGSTTWTWTLPNGTVIQAIDTPQDTDGDGLPDAPGDGKPDWWDFDIDGNGVFDGYIQLRCTTIQLLGQSTIESTIA